MAKFCLKKGSKRVSARKRYKIEKKVREHNRKVRREAKKNPKSKKKANTVQVPNSCPFKEDILKEVEVLKKQREEEKQKQREAARERKREQLSGNLEGLVTQAQNKQIQHDSSIVKSSAHETEKKPVKREENSLKAHYKEFKKVLDSADVILEVVDARDPLGTRCKQVEEAVQTAKGNKRLVLVLNKADLVPRENLDNWLKYLRRSLPAVAFKSSTQDQSKRLGRKKLGKKTEDLIQGGVCFGAELLLSLLANYCRNSGTVKTSIRVGVVGLPNVGKSSVINSLKRSRACDVGNTPGVTKCVQMVQLDSKIKLLDSPGIVFANPQQDKDGPDDSSVALKNAVRIEALQDPFTPASAILKRVSKKYMMELYDILEYSSPDEFFAMKAARMGKFKKGGIPDATAAARGVLADWNSGKIRYYTLPPEDSASQLSAEIVQQFAKEFDIDSFATEEAMMLDHVGAESAKANTAESLVCDSSGPVDAAMEIEIQEKRTQKKVAVLGVDKKKAKKGDPKPTAIEGRKKKVEPLFEIEGNQKLNKLNKIQFKKLKKERARGEKAATGLAQVLEDIQITASDDYNFETDFKPK
ncbi:guanine nucleotide-binding protein-like 3 homolog [Neodiprion lecontei]|uniref:Guanine nucleotide-binding protein-like 3 homolog n=1 Tax=Neodiprion lecontei TaxID=441921 RepID=A0A6J0C585_NEOLC|nr:guanine nucleotide-binding protein-like 3 homolog [Neodiprion lecontei]